jgi:hypothetical protein
VSLRRPKGKVRVGARRLGTIQAGSEIPCRGTPETDSVSLARRLRNRRLSPACSVLKGFEMPGLRGALAALIVGACAPLRSVPRPLLKPAHARPKAATSFRPTSPRRLCRSTISRPFPRPVIIGRRATGPGIITIITGSLELGSSRRNRDSCGRQATGRSSAGSTPSGRGTGASVSGSMAGQLWIRLLRRRLSRGPVGQLALLLQYDGE